MTNNKYLNIKNIYTIKKRFLFTFYKHKFRYIVYELLFLPI